MGISGYVRLYRKLRQWGWYRDSVVKDVFLHLLITANFKDMPWMGRTIQAGQVVTSSISLANELGFTRQQVRRALSMLQSTGEIRSEATNRYTVITVVKWFEYQGPICSNEQYLDEYLNEKPEKTTSKTTSKESDGTISMNIISKISSRQDNQQKNQQTTNKQPQRKNVYNNNNIYIVQNEVQNLFERLWKLYPKKEGKGRVSDKQKRRLYEIGEEEMKRTIERYIKAKAGTPREYLQMGSTFFNSGYIDYLDTNYQPEPKKRSIREALGYGD